MSPTPVTSALPTAPIGYTWEATSAAVAARYGVPIGSILRFDLNTAPEPPALAAAVIAAGRFEDGLSEYPPADYARLTAAAARRYDVSPDEIVVGAGADEILDLIAKAFLRPGRTAIVPTPTYSMYRVLTEQRGATVVRVPRLGLHADFALDRPAIRAAAATADLIWLCDPNNPTALPEPDGTIAGLLADLDADARRAGRAAPIVVLDEAYAEFVGSSLIGVRLDYPRLIVVRTVSKAYGLAGLRVGFALAVRETVATIEPYRPPGSVSVVSVAVVTAALETDGWLAPRIAAVHAERDRLAGGLRAEGWEVLPSVTNFVLARFESPSAAAEAAESLLHRGLVPRTFGPGHPLADHLRITVRSADQDDRLVAAVRASTPPDGRAGR